MQWWQLTIATCKIRNNRTGPGLVTADHSATALIRYNRTVCTRLNKRAACCHGDGIFLPLQCPHNEAPNILLLADNFLDLLFLNTTQLALSIWRPIWIMTTIMCNSWPYQIRCDIIHGHSSFVISVKTYEDNKSYRVSDWSPAF